MHRLTIGVQMSITTTVHLNFRGDARPALAFYQSVFGGEMTLFGYADAHNVQDPAEADWIMWGEVRGDNGIHVMAYDVQISRSYDQGDRSFFVSVRGTDADELTGFWNGLIDGGEIIDAFGPAPWGTPLYGQVKDRFGVIWILDLAVAY
jgi:PhnB protein